MTPIDKPIGARWFEVRKEVVLVEVVEQRDEPPGRGDRALKTTVLASACSAILPGHERAVIEEVAHS